MARAFLEEHGKEDLKVFSAGSKPADMIHPEVIEAMRLKGLDLTWRKPVGINDLPDKSFDLVVTMGCGDTCPSVQMGKRIDWVLDDPAGQSLSEIISIRDQIEEKVLRLLQSLEETI